MKSIDKKLLTQSKRLKITADKLLANSRLVKILSRFGQVTFHGGYAADLLMNGDIDIYVIGKSFNKYKILKIFNTIVKSTTFNSYWLADYKKFTHKRRDIPAAYYIGLKTRIKKDEKWKIDIWFLTKKDLKGIKYFPLDKSKITLEQKLVILRLKDWCNQYNAVKYTPKGEINVSIIPQNEVVTFCVKDTGRGLDSSVKPNLFKKFSRGEGSFRIHTEGVGLGLYVAKMIVDAHQGRIWAESPGRDKGSTFCFSIPLKHTPKGKETKVGQKVK